MVVITLKIAGYTRISVDIEQDRDNTSIENQKAIISNYVTENFPVAQLQLYEDRDRSGYTFAQRESYQQMRSKLLSGEYNILVVKDFSRFSRRNSLGLLELETLRDAGVRIISIGDNIDYPTKDEWMLIQFKFLMNEFPVTDTSKKIKAIIKNRQKSGNWICNVPYGYRITNTKEMLYEVDPPAAEVVREIFSLYNGGWGYKKIANHLTDKGIPTPRANEIAWREAQGQKTKLKSKSEWSIISVSGILANDFYIGTLRQGKYTRKGINGIDERIDEENHIIIENAHTPIIDAKTFRYTQEQLKQRSKTNYRGEKKYATDYSGYLFCGDCGAPMFSMSRQDLQPAYTCGTYHRRGKVGCTSHHIRVDKLDELLKHYITKVRDNSAEMLKQLEAVIKHQPEREQEIGLTIDSLERQLSESKEQLKALFKRKLIDTMGKSSDEAEVINEAYVELEKELTQRIKGLETQISDGIDTRNRMLKTTRTAKTVIEVFDDIINKPKLEKKDIALIVERITIYDDLEHKQWGRIDIQLKADIDSLLRCGELPEGNVNFNLGIEDSLNMTIVQESFRHSDKVFYVNVVNSGDPLEIFTDIEGSVIFKKYSPVGELSEFAGQYAETLFKTSGTAVLVCDKDHVIAASGLPKKEVLERRISPALEDMLEQRKSYIFNKDENNRFYPIEGLEKMASVEYPIISAGDVCGAIMFIAEDENSEPTEVHNKLIQTAASFLGRQME